MSVQETRTIVAMDGTSKQLLAANGRRIAVLVLNPVGNAQIAYDHLGGTVTLANGMPLLGGEWDKRDGDDCPNGVWTCIGTNGQNVVVREYVRSMA